MLEKHGLQQNIFHTQIYKVRRKCAKTYFMDIFSAKMTSTQQSENCKHLLKPEQGIHASKIHTMTMFEKFGETLYEGGSYILIEFVPRREYIARHVKKDSKEKWCKNKFLLQVNDLADEFKCECEVFDHFGMLCIHALMVSFLLLAMCADQIIIRTVRRRKKLFI